MDGFTTLDVEIEMEGQASLPLYLIKKSFILSDESQSLLESS